jgi:hypothetical protein
MATEGIEVLRSIGGWIPPAGTGRHARVRKAVVLFFVVAVPWLPGGVTLAMLLSGNA